MGHTARAREQEHKARARLRVLHHYEQVTRNVSRTCRFFGISRTLFYRWRDRYRQAGLPGLQDGPRGPRHHPYTTPPHVVALILQIRRERQYGPLRISFFLERYHNVYVSGHTIHRILKRHRLPHVSRKRYRPGPRRRRELHVPGQSIQVDVKHLKLGGRRFYQFTAIDEATRYRVLRVYAHNSIRSATDFVEELRRRFPVAIQRIQTDHGSEFGTDFTWHLRDLGLAHRQIPRGSRKATGRWNGVTEPMRTSSIAAPSSGTRLSSSRSSADWSTSTTTGASTWRSAVAHQPSASASSASPRRWLLDAQHDAAREKRGPHLPQDRKFGGEPYRGIPRKGSPAGRPFHLRIEPPQGVQQTA